MGFAVADVRAAVDDLKEEGVLFEDNDAPEIRTIGGVADMEPQCGMIQGLRGKPHRALGVQVTTGKQTRRPRGRPGTSTGATGPPSGDC
jgi:hypothetical protein